MGLNRGGGGLTIFGKTCVQLFKRQSAGPPAVRGQSSIVEHSSLCRPTSHLAQLGSVAQADSKAIRLKLKGT